MYEKQGTETGALAGEQYSRRDKETRKLDAIDQCAQAEGPRVESGLRARIRHVIREGERMQERYIAAREAEELLRKYPEFGALLDALGRLGL